MTEYIAEHPAEVTIDLNEKKAINVLHVDDEPSFLKIVKQCLEMQGQFQVEPTLSVEDAMERLKKHEYDAVISDYQMPGKDGLEFLKELRDNGNEIPFIIFTGKGREEVAIRALNLGADQYINKAGDWETVYAELVHGLKKAVERRNAARMLKKSEEKYRNLVENFKDSIVIIDLKGNVLFANKATEKLTGYTERSLPINVRKVTPLKYWPKSLAMLRKAKKGQQIPYFESMIRRKDGALIPVESGGQAIFEDGKVVGIQIITRDISERLKAKDLLLENEQRFRSLLEAAPDVIYTISAENGTLTSLNPAFEKITGWKRSDWIGKPFEKLVHPNDLPLAIETFQKTIRGETLAPYELRVLSRSGKYLTGEFTSRPQVEKGKIVGEFGIARDVTERKRTEESLKESEEKFRTLFDESMDAIFVADAETGMLIDCNRAATELVGRAKSELIGAHQRTLHPQQDTAEGGFSQTFQEHLEEKEGQVLETQIITKKGETKEVAIKANLIELKGKKVLQGTFRDITERKRAELAVLESQEKFEGLFMGNPEAAVYLGTNFQILEINPRFEELFGYSLREIKGKHIDDVVVPKDKIKEAERLDKRALKGYVYHDTVRKRKDGTLIPVSISAAPITVEGRPIGYMGMYKDITESKLYEKRLSALNTYSRKLNTAKNMREIYCITMEAVKKSLGFETAFLMIVDKEMLCVVGHRGYPESFSMKLPLDGTKKGVSVKVVKTGRAINVPDAEKEDAWVEFMPGIRSALDVPVKIANKVLGVIGVDSKKLNAFNEKDQELLEILASHAATAMSNLEYAKNLEISAREIRESQQKFERLFMDNPEAAVHLDSTFHILNANPRFMRLFGYSLDEIKGKHINDVIVPKDKMEEAVIFDKRASKGETYHEDTVRKRKDESLVPVAFSAAPIIVEDQVIGHIAVYKDISQLKKTEEQLREALERLAKMNEKLRVIGGLTRHDARNKLGAITGNVYLAKKRLAGQEEVLNNLKEMEIAAEQMVRIFDFAKTYEMLGVEELRFTDVQKMVDEAVSLFSDLKGVKVVNNCRGLKVLADSLLRQLFYNLVDNSLKYGGEIRTIMVWYEEADRNKLRLFYEDDGVGIAEPEKKRLFQEGYGRGTGYGLYLIRKMCEGYGWNIQETGKEGMGAQFSITVPRIGEKGEINYIIT